jgi:hypothetical protein
LRLLQNVKACNFPRLYWLVDCFKRCNLFGLFNIPSFIRFTTFSNDEKRLISSRLRNKTIKKPQKNKSMKKTIITLTTIVSLAVVAMLPLSGYATASPVTGCGNPPGENPSCTTSCFHSTYCPLAQACADTAAVCAGGCTILGIPGCAQACGISLGICLAAADVAYAGCVAGCASGGGHL